ncbi:MAG TPA: MurR/RpiR family transcriptional regulator [Thermosynergistes sp.]|nr:MurR/RpiR family transcriptional regulator [Thermosynergistes sp.]
MHNLLHASKIDACYAAERRDRVIQRLIQERLGDLPPGQAEVARFIAQNPQEAAFLTAAQIGLRVGVSESTVIRLAMALGYPGFPEMKAALAGQVRDQLSTLERLHRYDETSVEPSLLRRALREDMSNLSGALLSVDEEALEALTSAIVQAKETYILGLRSAHSLAYYLWFYLSWFLPHVQLLERETIWERITQGTSETLFVGVSFPRYTRLTVEALEAARAKGLSTAAITDSSVSPLAAYAQIVLAISSKPISFIDSFSAPMSVLNALILCVVEKCKDHAEERLEELEHIWRERKIYL